MLELCILYIHHRDDSLTRFHARLIRRYNPAAAFVPLTFRQGMPNALRFPFNDRRTIHGEWGSADLLVYDWFQSDRKILAARYLILEYDTLVTLPVREFYRQVWDQDAAGAQVMLKETNPDWTWFQDLDPATPLPLGGLVPFCGILLSHQALIKMVDFVGIPPLVMVNSECRLGTLARIAGFQLTKIRPDAERFIRWTSITPDAPGIWHPVKSELRAAAAPDTAG